MTIGPFVALLIIHSTLELLYMYMHVCVCVLLRYVEINEAFFLLRTFIMYDIGCSGPLKMFWKKTKKQTKEKKMFWNSARSSSRAFH